MPRNVTKAEFSPDTRSVAAGLLWLYAADVRFDGNGIMDCFLFSANACITASVLISTTHKQHVSQDISIIVSQY